MRRVVAFAFGKPAHSPEGNAAVLLVGVDSIATPLDFDLRRVGGPLEADRRSLIRRRLRADSCRLTDRGLLITLESSTARVLALYAGDLVEMDVPALGIRAAFLWPGIGDIADVSSKTEGDAIRAAAQSERQPTAEGMVIGGAIPRSMQDDSHRRDDRRLDRGADTVGFGHETGEYHPTARSARLFRDHDCAGGERSGTSFVSYPPHGGVVKTGRFTRVGLTWLAVVGTIGAHLALWFLLESRTLQVPGRHLTTQTDLVELHDLLVPRSEHSPSGLSSASVHADRALAIAAANLHGLSGHRDSEEGAFWLRKHLSVRFGDPQMLRALTELGATYAEPTRGEPNYRKASQIWQFAAAWGDRLAMCLLAKLHSGAFGGASKPMVAERWRARAAPAGGCEEAALPGASR